MKIEVSVRDIRDGAPRNGQLCAISGAIRRQVPRANMSVVYTNLFAVTFCGQVHPLPKRARRFLKRFDKLGIEKRLRMRPFSFDLPDAAHGEKIKEG